MNTSLDPRVMNFEYEPKHFRDLYETPLGEELWNWLRNRDNIVRMETASYFERAAVEAIGPYLARKFGQDISEDRIKQFIGHMVRQIMEAIGYELVQKGMNIPRGLFSTGSRYQLPTEKRDKSMKITREQRMAWLEKTSESPFNLWLKSKVTDSEGKLDLDKLYAVAERYNINKREQYKHLNPGQQRMNIGIQLRKVVDPKEYGGD